MTQQSLPTVSQEMIQNLVAGKIGAIELGVKGKPKGFYSNHRIDFIPTPAGYQFAVRAVSGGRLGGGIYSMDIEETLSHSYKSRDKFLQPHEGIEDEGKAKFLKKMAEKRIEKDIEYFEVPVGE